MAQNSIAKTPRLQRKTAIAAAESIAKALGAKDDLFLSTKVTKTKTTGLKQTPRPVFKKLKSSSSVKQSFTTEAIAYLRDWMLSPDHIDNPYPTEAEKEFLSARCGIEMKQLTNWFVNNRRRIWKPKLDELKRKRGENCEGDLNRQKTSPNTAQNHSKKKGRVVSDETTCARDFKRKKTCAHAAKNHSISFSLNEVTVNVSPNSSSTDIDLNLSIMEKMPTSLGVIATDITLVSETLSIDDNNDDVITSEPFSPVACAGVSCEKFEPRGCKAVSIFAIYHTTY
jgi:hypothetical protein